MVRSSFSGPRRSQTTSRNLPDRLVVSVPLWSNYTANLADLATKYAVLHCPKMSGDGARHMRPVWGDGWLGVRWQDDYIWYQEAGIRPFTMFALAGKTIPMWIDDPTGRERLNNPRARTRRTESGKVQVLIFRKVAAQGARKTVRRKVGGVWTTADVPASYPGAPGRIERRGPLDAANSGRIYSHDLARHSGVRWRHPGLSQRGFIRHAIISALEDYDLAFYARGIYPARINPPEQRRSAA